MPLRGPSEGFTPLLYMLHPTHGSYHPWMGASHPRMGGFPMGGRHPYGITPYVSSLLSTIGGPTIYRIRLPSIDSKSFLWIEEIFEEKF